MPTTRCGPSFGYDAAGRLVTVADADGFKSTTRYTYDGLGNMLTQTAPDTTSVTTFAYDRAGQIVSRTDALGGIARYRIPTPPASRSARSTSAVRPPTPALRHERARIGRARCRGFRDRNRLYGFRRDRGPDAPVQSRQQCRGRRDTAHRHGRCARCDDDLRP
ncbi:RHS repeat domain-containing protein [Sphingomonas sp. MMS24-JH45]